MTDFNKILDKAKELETKMKESQAKIKNITVEGVSGSNSVKVTLNGEGEMQMIEISDEVLKEDKTKNISLFKYLYNALIWFDSNKRISNFLIKLMFDLTKFLGFQPNLENENLSYFDLRNGYTTNTKPEGEYIKGKLKKTMILFLGTTFDKVVLIKLNKIERIKLFNYALDYFKLHLQGFNKPKSISILNEIYNPI